MVGTLTILIIIALILQMKKSRQKGSHITYSDERCCQNSNPTLYMVPQTPLPMYLR